MKNQPSWGVIATAKAPAREILNFAAHHLELGADQVTIYLDTPNDSASLAMQDHPACRCILTDDAYWQAKSYRPVKHQVRQQLNATHCLSNSNCVDWLAHIDIDEFLWPIGAPVATQLGDLHDETLSARVRPIEAMEADPGDPPTDGTIWFKSCAADPKERRAETKAIYPNLAHI